MSLSSVFWKLMVGCLTLSSLLADPVVSLELVVEGLAAPILVTSAGDDSGRLFIVEQRGVVRVLREGEVSPEAFLDIRDRVTFGGERGLLGLAFHPVFQTNGRFFVNYTRTVGGQLQTVVSEFGVEAGNPDVATTGERILLEFNQPFANHNGGHLAFGPDGYLYIATGDGGSAGDPQGNAQNTSNLLGKILRIDVNRGEPYEIPPDNPFAGLAGFRAEIWAYGLRNPWRFSFDREGRRLIAADVGQNHREEINLIVRGGNYGWNIMEGTLCYPPGTLMCDQTELILPIAEYGDPQMGSSVTGGYVYRGTQATLLRGTYFFADYITGELWGLSQDPRGGWRMREFLRTSLSISSFGEDDEGELYVVDHGGAVYRMVFEWRELFPHIGLGDTPAGRFRTRIILANPEAQEVGGELRFFDTGGSPMQVAIDGTVIVTHAFQLPPLGSRSFVLESPSGQLSVGWVEAWAEIAIAGSVLFSLLDPEGGPIGEAGVASSRAARLLVAEVERRADSEVSTALALANPGDSGPVQVEVTMFPEDGGDALGSVILLGARAQTASFIEEIVPVPETFRGTLRLSASGEVIATLLRTRFGVQLSSLPLASD